MAKMRPKMAKMRPKMGKMRPKMAKMRPKTAKMKPKMGKMTPIEKTLKKKPLKKPLGVFVCMHVRPSRHSSAQRRADGRPTAGRKKKVDFPGEGSPGGVRGGYKTTMLATPTTPWPKAWRILYFFLIYCLSIFYYIYIYKYTKNI